MTIEDFIIDVDTSLKDINNIVISPLAIIANNIKLDNVNISGSVKYSKLPDKEINISVNTSGYFIYSNDVEITDDCKVDVVNQSVNG